MIYWLDFGVSVDAAYAATIGAELDLRAPDPAVGQLYGSPTPAELPRFRALARAYGAPGSSFFDLDSAQPQELAALAAPAPELARRARRRADAARRRLTATRSCRRRSCSTQRARTCRWAGSSAPQTDAL